jgi:hypothetical protein
MIFDTLDQDLDVVLENWSCQRMSLDRPSCLESGSSLPSSDAHRPSGLLTSGSTLPNVKL